jgi:hypothetical protein
MTAKDRAAWLATLNVGDRVAVNVGSFTPVWLFYTVERFTKLHVVLTSGGKCRRADGGIVGSNRYSRIVDAVSAHSIRGALPAQGVIPFGQFGGRQLNARI